MAIRGTLLQSFQIETLRHGPIILTRQKLENQIVADAIQPAGLTWLTGLLGWLGWLSRGLKQHALSQQGAVLAAPRIQTELFEDI